MNIFIDTTEFVSSNFNFSSESFTKLKEYCSSGEANLIICDITINEIYSRIDKNISIAASAIKSARRKSYILKNIKSNNYDWLFNDLNQHEVKTVLKNKIDVFLKDCKAEIIKTTGMSSKKIFDSYFNNEAPFDLAKKKHEFPDAFVIFSLANWSYENNENIFIVSNDGDFKRTLPSHRKLNHLKSIESFFEKIISKSKSKAKDIYKIHESLERDKLKLFDTITENLSDYTLHIEDANPEAEGYVQDAKINDIYNFAVISITNSSALILAEVNAELKAFVNCYDPTSWISDSEEHKILYYDKFEGVIDRNSDFKIKFEIEFQDKKFQNFEVEYVIIIDPCLSINLSEY